MHAHAVRELTQAKHNVGEMALLHTKLYTLTYVYVVCDYKYVHWQGRAMFSISWNPEALLYGRRGTCGCMDAHCVDYNVLMYLHVGVILSVTPTAKWGIWQFGFVATISPLALRLAFLASAADPNSFLFPGSSDCQLLWWCPSCCYRLTLFLLAVESLYTSSSRCLMVSTVCKSLYQPMTCIRHETSLLCCRTWFLLL